MEQKKQEIEENKKDKGEKLKKITLKRNLKYFCLFLTIILSIFTFNITTGRYTGEISSAENIIAEPILTLSNNEQTIKIEDMLPRTTKNCRFFSFKF